MIEILIFKFRLIEDVYIVHSKSKQNLLNIVINN